MVEMTFENAKELERAFKNVEKKIGTKIVRNAVRDSLKPILTGVRTNAKANVGGEMGGLLAKNIVLRRFKKRRKGQYGMSVRIKSKREGAPSEFVHTARKSKYAGGKTYIPAAIEYGHGASKEAAARPFFRPGIDANKAKCKQILKSKFNTLLEIAGKPRGI